MLYRFGTSSECLIPIHPLPPSNECACCVENDAELIITTGSHSLSTPYTYEKRYKSRCIAVVDNYYKNTRVHRKLLRRHITGRTLVQENYINAAHISKDLRLRYTVLKGKKEKNGNLTLVQEICVNAAHIYKNLRLRYAVLEGKKEKKRNLHTSTI